jgi:hypothetical protein
MEHPTSLEPRRGTQFPEGLYAKRVIEISVLSGLEPGLFDEHSRLALHYAKAIARVPEPECPNTDGWWAVSDVSGRAFPRLCKRWTCPSCVRVKRAAALVSIQDGLCAAREDRRHVRFVTFTDGSGSLDFQAFYAAWSRRLRPRLRRMGKLGEYACALELQPDGGRLHGHFLFVDSARGGGFIPQALLSEMADAAGFGKVTDIRFVRDIPPREQRLSAYFTKGIYRVQTAEAGELGSYMAKAKSMEDLGAFAASRLRPFRVSQGWPLKLREAQRRLLSEWYGEPDEAESWTMVQEARLGPFLRAEREHQRECAEGRVSLGAARRTQMLSPYSR